LTLGNGWKFQPDFSQITGLKVVFIKQKLKNNVFIITGEMEFYNPPDFIGKT
jgi:hypothetical protein